MQTVQEYATFELLSTLQVGMIFLCMINQEEDSSQKPNAIAKCLPLVTLLALSLLLITVLINLVCLFRSGLGQEPCQLAGAELSARLHTSSPSTASLPQHCSDLQT